MCESTSQIYVSWQTHFFAANRHGFSFRFNSDFFFALHWFRLCGLRIVLPHPRRQMVFFFFLAFSHVTTKCARKQFVAQFSFLSMHRSFLFGANWLLMIWLTNEIMYKNTANGAHHTQSNVHVSRTFFFLILHVTAYRICSIVYLIYFIGFDQIQHTTKRNGRNRQMQIFASIKLTPFALSQQWNRKCNKIGNYNWLIDIE